jgi:hypothetical protein
MKPVKNYQNLKAKKGKKLYIWRDGRRGAWIRAGKSGKSSA